MYALTCCVWLATVLSGLKLASVMLSRFWFPVFLRTYVAFRPSAVAVSKLSAAPWQFIWLCACLCVSDVSVVARLGAKLANIPTTDTVTAKRSTAARIGDTPFLTLTVVLAVPVQRGENRLSTVRLISQGIMPKCWSML